MFIHKLLIDLHYLPSVEYFCYLYWSDEILLERFEFYRKQSYRNRALIHGANKTEMLIVPVKHYNSQKPVKDVEIEYGFSWQKQHIRSLQTAYGKAPYYDYYIDDIKNILLSKPRYLFDLNDQLLTKCLEFLNIKKKIFKTNGYNDVIESGVLDLRDCIHPKKVRPEFFKTKSVDYFQVFGRNFERYISIIDLIFCEGPNAKAVLSDSTEKFKDKNQ
ncbi:MAG: WbqC family protein [Cyclobacteriaceae bacterium]|nr:WbqC family protein [Cyclobacteriaceae bacterium]